MKIIGTFVALAMGYLIAAAFSESVAMDLSLTEWDSAWTYAAWAAGYMAWKVSIYVAVAATFFALIRGR